MFYHAKTDSYITPGVSFTIEGIQYPASYFYGSTPEILAEAGFVEVKVEGDRPDDRYYWVEEAREKGVIHYVSTPKDLTVVKNMLKEAVNVTAASLLQPTDWMVVRAFETGSMPAGVSEYRAAVRKASNDAVAKITSAKTVEKALAVSAVWPKA